MLSPGTSVQALHERVRELREEMNALILAHYYTVPEVQNVADIVGDSLALARATESTEADVIVFAGVYFMAETAAILNPDKLVLMPDNRAGCPLADSCPADEFREFKALHPDALVITYINSSTDIKAESDIVCTSSNAERIVSQIPPDRKIIFGPDRNLGAYVMRKLNREMILWEGCCYVHDAYRWEIIRESLEEHPGAKFIAHPECREEVLVHADFVGSTGALLDYSEKTPVSVMIVATEPGILYEMEKRSPDKIFIPAPKDSSSPSSICMQMKQNTLEKLCECMELRRPRIEVDPVQGEAALRPIRRMLEMS